MIIDTHSHVGIDYYGGEMPVEEYQKVAQQIGVDVGFLMPPPWPCIRENDQVNAQLLWEHDNYVINHYFKLQSNNQKKAISVNPYRKINDYYFSIVENASSIDRPLFFVPLIHGVLDTAEYLEELLRNPKIIAVKIHGFGSGFFAEDIRSDLIELMRYYQVPLIIHTSVYNYNVGYGKDTKYFRNKCHPLNWAKFLIGNQLKGVLNHGAALNEETIELVNKHDNLMIGIGPDADLNNDYYKMDISKQQLRKGYLPLLKKNVDPNKLLFDVDYKWNIDPDSNQLDVNQLSRLMSIWNDDEFSLITCQNARSFYPRMENNATFKQYVKKKY